MAWHQHWQGQEEEHGHARASDHADTCEGHPWKVARSATQGHRSQGHGQGRSELHTLYDSKIQNIYSTDRWRKVNMKGEWELESTVAGWTGSEVSFRFDKI